MKTKNRIIPVFTTLILILNICLTGVQALTYDNNTAQFRGTIYSAGIVDSKTPTNSSETTLLWSENINTGWQGFTPVTIGDYLYMTARTADGKYVIQKRNIKDGTVIKQAELSGSCGFFSFLSYGEGKIFVPVTAGVIQAFNAETLESLWITKVVDYKTQFDAQTIAPTVYYNGYVYTGLTNGNAKDGMYYCVSAKDDDPSKPDEIKDYTWTYTPPEKYKDKEGYYWSGGVVVGNRIIFGGEAGEIVSHDLITNTVYDTYECNEAIRSTIQYDKTTKNIIFATKSGNIHKLKVNADGTFDDASHKYVYLTPDITSSPVTYNGRIYIGNGGMGAMNTHKFSVIDAATLDIIYQFDLHTQSSPVITTAYSTSENKHKIYIYAAKYSSPDEIYCITDFEGNITPSFITLAVPTVKQYNTCTLTVDINGTLYYKNDSGWLYAYGNINSAFTAADVANAIHNLPSVDSLTPDDEIFIERAEYRLNSLSDSEKEKVSTSDKSILTSLRAKLTEFKDIAAKKAKLIKSIDSLPETIALADKDNIDSLIAIYNSLDGKDRQDIANYSKLEKAKSALDILVDDKTVSDMIAEINSLGDTVNYDSKKTVYTVCDHYDKLDETLKKRVTNHDNLIALKDKVDAVIKEVDIINDEIWNNIDPVNITLKDKSTIDLLISRYGKLSDTDKVHIKNYKDVLYAQKVINGLEKGTVVTDVFENIMGNPDANYRFEGKTSDGKDYVISFNGKDIEEPSDFDAKISFVSGSKEKIEKLANNALIISFSNSSKLPGKATVEINVGLPDGIYSLYYFNEQTQKAEFVENITVKNGKTSFVITHCSDYFIAKELINQQSSDNSKTDSSSAQNSSEVSLPKTGDSGNIQLYIALSISIIAIAVIYRKKSKAK